MAPSYRFLPTARTRTLTAVLVIAAMVSGGFIATATARADETTDAARWDFTTGAASDVSWHGHDGVAGAGVQLVTDVGATFNGTDAGEITVDYAKAYQPEPADADDVWRLEVKGVTPAVVGGTHRTIAGTRAGDTGWALYILPDRRFEFWMAQTGGAQRYAKASTTATAVAGSTYDITVTRIGNTFGIAVSGAATGSGQQTLNGGYIPAPEGTPLRFGNGGPRGTELFYNGRIVSARIAQEVVGGPTPEPTTSPTTTPTASPSPSASPDPLPLPEATYEKAAADVLERAIGDAADQVEFDLTPGGSEKFTIAGSDGDIQIDATTPVALSAAAGWYLKYVTRSAVNLGNPTPEVPTTLPAPDAPLVKTAHEGSRFAFNDTNEGYTDPYLDWEGWQRLLDNLALHGVNQVFLSIGTDAVFHELLKEYGYSDAEARAWIPQPAHQPWWVLQNISSEGQEPMTQAMLDERADLARRIVERTEELGMVAVLPGYFGTVPTDFAQRNPGANVVEQGTWSSYQRPGWLDPTTQLFADVAADYYRISDELIGSTLGYKMDPLHEGGRPGNVSVPAAASGIEDALRKAHPKAIWSLLGWQSNPSSTLLSGVKDKSKLLIVDGLSDTTGTLDRESRWPGIPWAFGSIYNFGGNTSMGAISTVWLDRYFAARDKSGSAMAGVAILPEGFYNNPAAYELMAELPWMDAKPDHGAWFREYAAGRYGTDAAAEAWDIIADTAYSMEPIGTHSESHDSLFAAQPSLTATKARACCAQGKIRYDLAEFATALPALIDAAPSVTQKAAYEYDLVDVTRQVLANQSHTLLPQIRAAYEARDRARFDELTATWLALIAQLDDVIGTNAEFMLGAYVDRAVAQNDEIGRYDLQNLLTTWGTKDSFSLHDYANREWQGLVGDFYADRWTQYFNTLRSSLQTGAAPASIDWFSVDETWAKADHDYPATPVGPTLPEARQALELLSSAQPAVTLSAGVIRPGGTTDITASVQNTSPLGAIEGIVVTLTGPEGLALQATSPTVLEDLAAGETRTITWKATVTDAAKVGAVARLTATAAEGDATVSASSDAIVGGEPSAPWKTYSTEQNTVFAQSGDQVAIRTLGADMSRTTRKFSAVYQDGLMLDGQAAVVRVDQQTSEGSRPWARTGIIVNGDVTNATSPIAMLTVTPGNGCALSWNTTASGSIDKHESVASFGAPVWLRLVRVGNSFEGACSVDGITWKPVGTASPVGMPAQADVGLFGSAVNGGSTDRLLGVFSDFSIGDALNDVTIASDGEGTAASDVAKAAPGTLVPVTATPDTGHHLVRWETEPATQATTTANWGLELTGIVPGALASSHQAIASSRGVENRGWTFYIAPDGELQFYLWPTGASNWQTFATGVRVVPGETYNAAVGITEGTLTVRVSGAATAEETFVIDRPIVNSGSSPIRFGNGGNAGEQFFYRGALGDATITSDGSPLAAWDFEAGAADSTGNGHDGAASAGATFAGGAAVFGGADDSEITVAYDLGLEPGMWLRMPAVDVTATAVFEANRYTVAYDADGGTGTIAPSEFAYGEKAALSANAFTREAYVFAGWTRERGTAAEFADRAEIADLTTAHGATVTLYAVWSEVDEPLPPTLELGSSSVRAGDPVAVSGTGFEPGEKVRITLFSDPVVLVELTADTSGEIAARVTIPLSTAPGGHHLQAAGLSSGLSARAAITVVAATDEPEPGAGEPGAGGPGSGGGTDGGGSLPATGGLLATGLALAAALLVAFGLGLIAIRRRARERMQD